MGRMVAKTLAHRGASTIIVDRDAENGEKTAAEINQSGNGKTAFFYQCNIAVMKEIRQLIQSLASPFPKIDVLINNAGIIVENVRRLPRVLSKHLPLTTSVTSF
jgi:NAD(P)-dependent dehydrogenase (short-subunit alcohol dehydrogenase family)